MKINVFDYANEIVSSIGKGILLTTEYGGKANSMSIGWGTFGVEWRKPIFTVFVRENRYTKEMLDKSGEFTINIPYGKPFDKNIITFCGTKSGRDVDKIKELNLSVVKPEIISAPAFKELPLTLECKVIYKQKQDENAVDAESKRLFYPQDIDGSFYGSNKDIHTAYYGEIVSAYIVED